MISSNAQELDSRLSCFPRLLSITFILMIVLLIGLEKYALSFAVAMLPMTYIFVSKLSYESLMLLIIASVFFPLQFQFGGKDAFTSAQLLIIYVFLQTVLKDIVSKKYYSHTNTYNFSLNMLLLSGAVSSFTIINSSLFGKSIRTYVYLLSSVLLYKLIVKIKFDDPSARVRFLQKALEFIIVMVCIQILIGVLILYFPNTGQLFTVFLPQNMDTLEFEFADNYFRFRSIILNPENTGELIAVISPSLYYLIVSKFKVRYLIYLFVLIAGLFLSVTRSGAILFILSSFISLFIFDIKLAKKVLSLMTAPLFISLPLLFFPEIANPIFSRLNEALSLYETTGHLADAAGRGFVLESGWPFLLSTLSIVGNGMLTPADINPSMLQFHNLLMTIIFQNGIFGSFFYLFFLLCLFVPLLKLSLPGNSQYSNLHRALCLSCFLLFLNEMKFEFNRIGSYYILIWVMFSLYSLSCNILDESA